MWITYIRTYRHNLNQHGARLWLFAVLLLLLGGCATTSDNKPAATTATQTRAQAEFQVALQIMKAGMDEQAKQRFATLIEKHPKMTGAYVNLGLIHLKQKNWEAAEQHLSKATALNPKHAAAFNHLGITYRNLGRFRKAENAYKRALEIEPGYANVHLNLGILYDIYLDTPEPALKHYQQYQKLNSNADPQVNKWIVELKRRLPKKLNHADTAGENHHG